jgi:hypothetical protein
MLATTPAADVELLAAIVGVLNAPGGTWAEVDDVLGGATAEAKYSGHPDRS